MAVKIKPVQPTEIKDKKIAREVIEQIRKSIPPNIIKRNEAGTSYLGNNSLWLNRMYVRGGTDRLCK